MGREEELLRGLIDGASVDVEPQSRSEAYLKAMIDGDDVSELGEPQSRIEELYSELADVIEGGGGGGGSHTLITPLSVEENGTYTAPEGTAYSPVTVNVPTGGGFTELKPFILRPDAELVQRWDYDKLIVADEGVTLPAYSTSSKTLKDYNTFSEKPVLDIVNNDYLLTYRMMAAPIYSDSSTSAGKYEFFISSHFYEPVAYKTGDITIGGIQSSEGIFIAANNIETNVYCYSASEIATANGIMGAYLSLMQPAMNGRTLYVRSPSLCLSGHFRGLTQSWHEKITDIRYQYICELYKAPKGSMNVNGWQHASNNAHIINCWNNGGKLT